MTTEAAALTGYRRADGRAGVRNVLVVAYLVECAHHVARAIADGFPDRDVHLIGFPGCYPNAYALGMLEKLCTHPNVGAVLLVSLGCEGMDKRRLESAIAGSGRPAHLLGIQQTGGTRKTTAAGRAWIEETLPGLDGTPRTPMRVDELTVGTICGGSDATSGLTAKEYEVLIVVKELGDRAIPAELSRILLRRPPGITTLLNRMEKRGLVKRKAHPDNKKIRIVAMTQKGQQALEVAGRRHVLDDILRTMSSEKYERLWDLLEELKDRAAAVSEAFA